MEPQRRTMRHDIDHAVDLLRRGDVKGLYSLWHVYLKMDAEPAPELEAEDRFWQAYALYHFGIALEKYKHHKVALDLFSKCVATFGQDSDSDVAHLVNQSLVSVGMVAHNDDQYDEAIKNYNQARDRLRSASSSEDRKTLATAMVNGAASLVKSGAVHDALTAFEEAYARFKEDDDPHVCRKVAYALEERVRILGETGVHRDRIASAYADFFFECKNSKDPAILRSVFTLEVMMPKDLRSSVASLRKEKANASRQARYLLEEGANQSTDINEKLATFDEALQLFGENPKGEDQFWAVRAMLQRAAALQRAQRNQEAVAAFTTVIERFQDSSDAGIRKLVNLARADACISFGALRDFDKAVSYLDASIDEVKNASHREDRQALAQRMFNRATMFREAGRMEDAVRAFDALYDRFAADDDPKVCQFVALAVFNKANGLRQAGERARAMPALRFAFDHCAESHDSLIKERAARALFSLAGEHAALKNPKEFAATLHELAVTCGSAAEPAIQEIIGQALEVCPVLLTSLPPAAHSLRSEYNRQLFIGILGDFKDRPELLKKALKEQYETLEYNAKEAKDSHDKAVKVLSEYWLQKKPFAVMLRNFASEAMEFSMPEEGKDFPWRALIQLPIGANEERVQAAVGSLIPLISISNPIPHMMDMGKIPKLEMRNEVWVAAIKIVIKIAGLILVRLDSVTEGVLTELQAIVDEGRQFSTVVIVSHAIKDNELARELKAAQLVVGRPPTDPAIPRYAFVIDETELPPAGGGPLLEIRNLLILNGVIPESAPSG